MYFEHQTIDHSCDQEYLKDSKKRQELLDHVNIVLASKGLPVFKPEDGEAVIQARFLSDFGQETLHGFSVRNDALDLCLPCGQYDKGMQERPVR